MKREENVATNRPGPINQGDPNITMTVRAGISSNHGLFVGHVRFHKFAVLARLQSRKNESSTPDVAKPAGGRKIRLSSRVPVPRQ